MTDEPTPLFGSKTIQIGDIEYTVNELSGKAYDECVELSKTGETDAFGAPRIDRVVLMKFMSERAVTPKLDLKAVNDLPFTKRASLFEAINEVHWPTGHNRRSTDKPETAGKG